ncbi:MAG: molybdopterin oxidoreductase [Candidatus Abyssobacteria bacterium SURF_17]|uniref:Molybdopterin oxidoreductase n=1 Tax=Candidatus Abyssobacteria bacterium SURF_17 TaxID=2093361 RepID=A0A419EPQ7_9BACT|nr:MAG: molybdopterin oxidoreductase [Candidatus Abyssubacteria bacterium SURF_17]
MTSEHTTPKLERCSRQKFLVWLSVWGLLLAWGLYGAFLCLFKGLNQTGMNNYFVFGLWITVDLAIIALGAGAFFSGFLFYILKVDHLKDLIGAAVVIGFICYSGAIGMLTIDIGQPLRGYFSFWHANVHSMLTEVIFCITCYLFVLTIEFTPLILENKRLSEFPLFKYIGENLHGIMAVFALVGTFLSFFHQGSLGGMFGVLFARPFAYRTGVAIWPWTFFLFILSAIASGPALTTLVVWTTQKVTGKQLVRRSTLSKLAKLSATLFFVYLILKAADTVYWANVTAPQMGFAFTRFYQGPYGMELLFLELFVFGLLPAVLLLIPKAREHDFSLVIGCLFICMGIVLNRFVMTVQTLSIPVLPFEKFVAYAPTWQEWAVAAAVLGYGVIVYSLSYRYLHLFPREHELNA